MTDRERWIVYPLLFLSIGLGMRNGVEIQADAQNGRALEVAAIRCQVLEVVSADGKPRISAGSAKEQNSGLLTIHSESGETVLALAADRRGAGVLELFAPDGKLQTHVGSSASGAALTLLDRQGESELRLGYTDHLATLIVRNPETGHARALFAVDVSGESGQPNSNSTPPRESSPADGTDQQSPPTTTK